MPVQVSYPGVYIEELPDNEHVIGGAPTAIAAFLGRAVKGAVNEPVMVQSFADFETLFGGLDKDYPLGYAVQDYFMNGGNQALIVRLFNAGSDEGASSSAIAQLTIDRRAKAEFPGRASAGRIYGESDEGERQPAAGAGRLSGRPGAENGAVRAR